MTTSSYTVSGMTCGHCVESVSAEVGRVPGVSAVSVELASGQLTVASERPVDQAAIRSAVEEAGYELVGAGQTTP
jgi:copper ion binding protein